MNRTRLTVHTLLAAVLLTASCADYDYILKGGTIYDGSGAPAIVGDVAIRKGRIAAVGEKVDGRARTVIDVSGLTVTPGFIDIHSHSDRHHLICPQADSRIYQGITTELGGNCGSVYFPKEADGDMGKFRDILTDSGLGINFACLVGHGDVRETVVGPYDVPATDEQVEAMCALLDDQLSKGAAGLSFGLEYAPGCYGDMREMVALCKVVAKHDALYAIHMRNEDDHVIDALTEAIEVARQSGARLQVSHLKAQNPANFDKLPTLLAMIDAAREEGIDIAFDRYPYTAFSTGFTSFIPKALRDGTREDILKRLKDPRTAALIDANIDDRIARFGGPDKVLVASCHEIENKCYSGKSIAECCEIYGMTQSQMVRHLLISEKLSVRQATFAMKESNLRDIYLHPLSMPGSDGYVYSPKGPLSQELPHPRSYGTFPRFFQTFVRETGALDMATAVAKCTSLPASRLGLTDRGLLKADYWADVVVFNPETIAERSTYAQPHQFPTGIVHVFVNGRQAIADGKHTGVLAGRVL